MTTAYDMDIKTKLSEMIRDKSAVIGIIGLGYVGLPLAIHFGQQGFKVTGFDLDTRKIDRLLHGESYIKHVPNKPIRDMIDRKQFDATFDFSRLVEADCILICVPTPLTDKREPELAYLMETTATISQHLRNGQLIVLESTTYPGTTEEMMLPRLQTGDLKVGRDFFLAFSPEREDPGNQKYNSSNIPKVVGGVTPACLEVATNLYKCITQTVPVSSTRAAELTKLLENTYRSVNIALVNEIKVLAHKMSSTKIAPQILAAMDAVIIVTDHSAYDFAEIVKHANLVIDTRNATRGIGKGREKFVMA